MDRPPVPGERSDGLLEKLIGLGERSFRKSYYTELQSKLEEVERFRDILDLSKDAIFLLEVPGCKLIDANLSACRFLAMARSEMFGMSIFRVSGLGTVPEAKELLTAAQPSEKSIGSVETVLYPKNGEPMPVEATLNRHWSGDREYAAVVARDISERRRSDEVLVERTRLAELGSRIGRALTEVEDPDAALQCCAEAFEQLTDAAFVRIWTADPEETALELKASAGSTPCSDGEHSRIDLRDSPFKLGIICRERRAYLTNSVIDDPQIHNLDWARKEGVVAFAGYPLVTQGQLVGVIAIYARCALSDIVLRAMSSVADEIAIGIERHRARVALKIALRRAEEGRDRINAILRSIGDGLIVTDMSGRISLMNRRAERQLGIAQGLAIGEPFGKVIGNRVLREHLAELLSVGGYAALADLEMSDYNRNEIRIVQARTSQVRNRRGVTTALVTTFRDVTHEREVDRLKSEFITTAAHELRTPLTSVKGFSELLLSHNEISPEERREYLSYIFENAGILEKIVEELLDLSRIEAGRSLSLNRANCSIKDLLARVVGAYRSEFPGFRFELDLPEDDFEMMLDAAKIHGVVTNLLSNAVKYSAKAGTVSLQFRKDTGECLVVVEDDGIGMSKEQLAHCFDRFYRADTADTAVGGLGLGLAIARAVVEAHGGRIWGESAEGRGTKMVFTLPMEKTSSL